MNPLNLYKIFIKNIIFIIFITGIFGLIGNFVGDHLIKNNKEEMKYYISHKTDFSKFVNDRYYSIVKLYQETENILSRINVTERTDLLEKEIIKEYNNILNGIFSDVNLIKQSISKENYEISIEDILNINTDIQDTSSVITLTSNNNKDLNKILDAVLNIGFKKFFEERENQINLVRSNIEYYFEASNRLLAETEKNIKNEIRDGMIYTPNNFSSTYTQLKYDISFSRTKLELLFMQKDDMKNLIYRDLLDHNFYFINKDYLAINKIYYIFISLIIGFILSYLVIIIINYKKVL